MNVTISTMNSDTDNVKELQLPPVKPRLLQGSTLPVPIMFAVVRKYTRRSKTVAGSYADTLIVQKIK